MLLNKSDMETLNDFHKTSKGGRKVCEDPMMYSVGLDIFRFVKLRIIMKIEIFCLELSLKNHSNFSRPVCGNPGEGFVELRK